MTTVESMRNTVAEYTRQRSGISAELLKLNGQLVSAKTRSERKRIEAAIKNFEQEIKRLDKLVDDTNNDIKRVELSDNKFDAKTEAYKAGIDPNKAWADAIASGIGSVANTVTAVTGANAVTRAVGGDKGKPKPDAPKDDAPKGEPKKDNMMLYIGIAIVAFLMLKK
jgi:hypothetical protein